MAFDVSKVQFTIDEGSLAKLPSDERNVYIYEWLSGLNKTLLAIPSDQQNKWKDGQKQLVEQLMKRIQDSPPPAIRFMSGECLATCFVVGDPYLIFDAVNRCNDMLKSKDDSLAYINTKLAAITCIGLMYEKLGRLVGRAYEETVQTLLKSLKNAESYYRYETFCTLEKIIRGVGTVASSCFRDILKAIKFGMTDRLMYIRVASSRCLRYMIEFAPFLYTTEIETVFSHCFRALDGSSYEVRCEVAQVLGVVTAATQKNPQITSKSRAVTIQEVLSLMSAGFLKGGIGGFLKAGEMVKSSTVSREVRVGLTHGYVAIVDCLGSEWLSRNMHLFFSHLLELLANPKAASTHMDAVYSRSCVTFILRNVISRHLGEKAQGEAIKVLINIMNSFLNEPQSQARNASPIKEVREIDPQLVQHVLVCASLEIGAIFSDLGTAGLAVINDNSLGLMDTIFGVLLQQPVARLAASWSLRCIAVSCPSQLTPLIERCLERVETLKNSSEAISGYSAALSALLGGVSQTPLGIPHSKGKLIFNIAEDFLRTAHQNGRLCQQRTQAGWLLIGSIMTLGPAVVRNLLPRMLLLWKNSFPRSSKELKAEKSRGDEFTWKITLDNRAGALSAISAFMTFCPSLVTEDVIRRLLTPVEAAISMLTALHDVIKGFGTPLKPHHATLRLRLYEVLLLLPPQAYENCYKDLLEILVAEFCLSENAANTTTSLTVSLCGPGSKALLGSWLLESDHKGIEDQLQPNLGFGALEHDMNKLYQELSVGDSSPGPLPLGVAVIDKSIHVFSWIFPYVAQKHRIQMFKHFENCIKNTRAQRQEAILMNIFTCLLGALKRMDESKVALDSLEVRDAVINLATTSLNHPNPVLRFACAEVIGRCGRISNEAKFISQAVQSIFEKLKSARDAPSRTGLSLSLGSLHHHARSLGSTQNFSTAVSILLSLSQDTSSPLVQVWALYSLTLIADSGGLSFRPYVEPTLKQNLHLLLNVPLSSSDVHLCAGKFLAALITSVGPELQLSSITTTRQHLLTACDMMERNPDALVQSEAVSCLQQIHLFAPFSVDLASLVPHLCEALHSHNLLLRKAAAVCLHQLTQREAEAVVEHANKWAKETKNSLIKSRSPLKGDHGLQGMLLAQLDRESDPQLIECLQKIITQVVSVTGSRNLTKWIQLVKEVLTASEPSSGVTSPTESDLGDNDLGDEQGARIYAKEESASEATIPPKWKTRVFAVETLCRIIKVCELSERRKIHFDLGLAREASSSSKGASDYLVVHLSDLIRMSFIAATSEVDVLRLEGLKALQLIIDKFAKVPEPEFPEHVILEQYQAQVGAALRPAFSPDTSSHVTAMACQVCSAWIKSRVAKDLNDLRRVHQLLVSSLDKLNKDTCTRLYNESASTLEKLAILKSWAEVYVEAMIQEKQRQEPKKNEEGEIIPDPSESLLQLVTPELRSLSRYWLQALRDLALLSLPPQFSNQLPREGGAFYTPDTIEAARSIYRESWPPILLAACTWLTDSGFKEEPDTNMNLNHLHLVFGLCMEGLCNPRSSEPMSYTLLSLASLKLLLNDTFSKSNLGKNDQLCIEVSHVLHRLLLTRGSSECQMLVIETACSVIAMCKENLATVKKAKLREVLPANQLDQHDESADTALASLGEGGETGDLTGGKSVVFSMMQICLCLLVRHMPQFSHMNSTVQMPQKKLASESVYIVSKCIQLLSELPELCSPKAAINVLPSILHILSTVIKESSYENEKDEEILIRSVTHCLSNLFSSSLMSNSISNPSWIESFQTFYSTILDLVKDSTCPASAPSQLTLLKIIDVFLTKAPLQVIKAPNLQYPCLNFLKHFFQNEQEPMQLKCIETLYLVANARKIPDSSPYIHAMLPRLIQLLGQIATSLTASQLPFSKSRQDLVISSFKTLQLLFEIIEEDKKSYMMSLYVPLLIVFLYDERERRNPYRTAVHSQALQLLLALGSKFPQEFRQIISQNSIYKAKLQSAVQGQQAVNSRSGAPSTAPSAAAQANRPQIVLGKIDPSKFVQK